nr:unnamed protein product [Callosobruchus analis]CAI5870182.1 unnamed protein product [Callosobruchus analis]
MASTSTPSTSTEANNEQYVEHSKKANDRTSVWFYFLQGVTGETAKCKNKKCNRVLKTKGGSTKGLHTHLSSVHKTSLSLASTSTASDTASRNPCPVPVKKQRKIHEFADLKCDYSLDAMLARMTALDGIPFRLFISSQDLRRCLKAMGHHDLPNSASTIKSQVMLYSNKVKDSIVSDIEKQKSDGKRFSLTFDEWTALSNKRFLNINVHGEGNVFWNTGLMRIYGSMPAFKCVELLEKRLAEYNLSLRSDIVAITTDGASVMKSVGNLISPYQQLCFAHGIQLAVIDVLYNPTRQSSPVETGMDEDDGIEFPDEEAQEIMAFLPNDTGDVDETESLDLNLTTNYNINTVIAKVRKVVRMFRKSPVSNHTLQTYVAAKHHKEMVLILDTKTRWSSLLDMLERFSLLKDCIQKSLIDTSNSSSITDEDFKTIDVVIDVLRPIKLAVEALCQRDANLITADITLKFLLEQLNSLDNALSKDMSEALKIRILQRRNPDLSGTLRYLHNPKYDTDGDDIFLIPDPPKIRKNIRSLLKRLSETPQSQSDSNIFTVDDYEDDSFSESGNRKSLKELLQDKINETMNPQSPDQAGQEATRPATKDIIKREQNLFEKGGARGANLQKAYEHLLTIVPTSVESERAFSAAGILCTKFRTRLNDNTLDRLSMLRAFLRK